MGVVICGAGAIGASIAYFLSLRDVEVTVVERTAVAAAASGKSGGFLALDWCDGSPLGPLARRSFALHDELAAELGHPWGYRRVQTLSVAASARRTLRRTRDAGLPEWIAPGAVLQQRLGTPATTAQVDPAAFTQGLMAAACARGAELRPGTVTGITRTDDSSRVTGVVVDGAELACDTVVIALGPWSAYAARWLPLPMVHGLKGHSLVFEDPRPRPAEALFVDCEGPDGEVDQPEVFPRPDGTTYVCGLSSQVPLPDDPAEVGPDAGAHARLLAMVRTFAPELAAAPVRASGACYRPLTRDGLPAIGRVPDVDGAYLATGHSVWGMLNAPATGEALAELLVDGTTRHVDLAPFDPARLPPARPGRAPI